MKASPSRPRQYIVHGQPLRRPSKICLAWESMTVTVLAPPLARGLVLRCVIASKDACATNIVIGSSTPPFKLRHNNCELNGAPFCICVTCSCSVFSSEFFQPLAVLSLHATYTRPIPNKVLVVFTERLIPQVHDYYTCDTHQGDEAYARRSLQSAGSIRYRKSST